MEKNHLSRLLTAWCFTLFVVDKGINFAKYEAV